MTDHRFPLPPEIDASPYDKPLADQFNRFMAAVFPTVSAADVKVRRVYWMIFTAGARSIVKASEVESATPGDDIAAVIVTQMMVQELQSYHAAVVRNLGAH